MTERLYYADARLLSFDAHIVEARANGLHALLDRTAFYPTSGGQPHDLGALNGIAVLDVIDEDDTIVHVLASPLPPGPVHGEIDAARRFHHMQQHTGQHLLSAVFEDLHGFRTLSFHLGDPLSTIDLDTPELTPAQLQAAELRANQRIAENRLVSVAIEDAASVQGLRKPSERAGPLRVVSIDGLDRSACGGTHVASTGQIGCLFLRRTEKMRGNTRIEFVCGLRAVAQARREYESLAAIGRLFSAAPEDTPGLVANAMEQARDSARQRQKLAIALAERTGRELYAATVPDAAGLRRHETVFETGPLPEETRTLAQSFTSLPKAVFLAIAHQPPTLLLAVSEDAGLHAGNLLKEALQTAAGRGGGSARMAQGSLPDPAALPAVASLLRQV
jgi:alanyl-tRNA synthetase